MNFIVLSVENKTPLNKKMYIKNANKNTITDAIAANGRHLR